MKQKFDELLPFYVNETLDDAERAPTRAPAQAAQPTLGGRVRGWLAALAPQPLLRPALADVARIQQIPEGTVKTRLFHARQKLKQCLQRMLAREGEAPLGEMS